MTLTCTKCSRINPADAIYCYFDGFALNGHAVGQGPVAVGSQPFVSPFVFSSGRSCRSFDELAIACQEDWDEAIEALQQGFFDSFFKNVGRADLAQVAAKAKAFPDKGRGLDQLLDKLPSTVLEDPQLQLESKEINLGQLKPGEDRDITIHLENLGMRLIYGNVTVVKAPWITLGGNPGATEKLVQFHSDLDLKLHIKGEKLRASKKPLVGKMIVDTNGGTETIVLKAEVPLQPYPGGVFAGAKAPRQIAEKARDNPKEAAPLFERGDVERWYKSNGWTYPVQGPAAAGMGAIQQFFEALGLTKPPKVSINQTAIELQGTVGQQLYVEVEVRTKEKRPVYAYGKSNQPWIEVHNAELKGRVAKIPIAIPMVPNRPGEQVTGKVLIQANGNQRFTLPVTIWIEHSLDFNAPSAPAPQLVPQPVSSAPMPELIPEPIPEPVPGKRRGRSKSSPEIVPELVPEPVPLPVPVPVPVGQEGISAPTPVSNVPTPRAPTSVPAPPPGSASSPSIRRGRGRQSTTNWAPHSVPAVLLFVVLLGIVVWDLVDGSSKSKGSTGGAFSMGDIKVNAKTGALEFPGLKNATPKLLLRFNNTGRRFGLTLAKKEGAKPRKRLTREPDGVQNNTIVKIDTFEHYFGKDLEARVSDAKEQPASNFYGQISKMRWITQRKPITVTQHVQLVPGKSGALDTCLVYYRIENRSKTASHTVGLRVMLDTYIGENDGVPFTVPGQNDFVNDIKILDDKAIPSYLEVVENPDNPSNPGTVVRLGLKGLEFPALNKKGEVIRVEPEPIHKMVICRWPGTWTRWDWEYKSMIPNAQERRQGVTENDSCVAIYWEEQPMNPGEVRHLAFTYGLGQLDFGGGAKDLIIRIPDHIRKNDTFDVTAYVYQAKQNQGVEIFLPPGFKLAKNETATKLIDKGANRAQVSWKVIAPNTKGTFQMKVKSRTSEATVDVPVKSTSIFG